MKPIEIFSEFISKELDGDIQKLLDYDLKQLKNNVVFGCPNRRFDPDDTNIMRAIYCLTLSDVWRNLSLENSGEGKLRGMYSSGSGFWVDLSHGALSPVE